MRFLLAILGFAIITPALADPFPIAVPQECRRLAIRERVPTIIRNPAQARMARDKLIALDPSEPMVARCRQAAAKYQQFM